MPRKIQKMILPVVLSAAILISPLNISGLPVSAANSLKPYIAVDSVPAIDKGRTVEGYIWFDEGGGNSEDFSKYSITMALEVTRGGTIWAPKPTYASPSVEVDKNGDFTCLFATGGNDISAERLYVYLIPRSFAPDNDVKRTESAALDKVIIDRYADGRTDIRHTKEDPNRNRRKLPKVNPPAVKYEQQKHPNKTNKLSLCYSPYTNGLSPETNSAVPMEQMRWQLNLIYPYADTIRLFGVSGELEKIYKPAKDEYNLRIIAGCWIDGRYGEKKIYEELDKLIDLANGGYADIAAVGSETL